MLSIFCNAIYGTVCIQLTHLSYNDCENMCTLSYHNQTRSMTDLPLFSIRSWSNGMRCMYFYILIYQKYLPIQKYAENSLMENYVYCKLSSQTTSKLFVVCSIAPWRNPWSIQIKKAMILWLKNVMTHEVLRTIIKPRVPITKIHWFVVTASMF